MSALVITVVWHNNLASGPAIADALALHFEGAEDEPSSGGLSIPTRIRCVGLDPSNPNSPPLDIPIDEGTINVVVLLAENDLATAFSADWSGFAQKILAETQTHPERMLVLPINLGQRRDLPPFSRLQTIPTSLFPGSGPSDPPWMRRLTLTIVAHLGNYLRRIEQFDRNPDIPFSQVYLDRFPLFISHAKRDGLEVTAAIRDHLANNNYGVATFIDAKDLPAGLDYEQQFTAAINAGAVVAIRSDAYSSRPWCRWETLEGKRLLRPIVVLDYLRDTELRINPYGGNVPALRLSDGEARDMDRAVLVIMTEVVRILVWNRKLRAFKTEVKKKYPTRKLIFLPRVPELVDIANLLLTDASNPGGRSSSADDIVILHPGPPLSRAEAALIKAIAPAMELCTPSDLGAIQ